MVGWFAVAVLLAAADSETALGKGFSDVAWANDVAIIASADGTVRSLTGNGVVDVAFTTGRKMVSVAVSADQRRVAVVGAGVVARSDDGGHIFRVEPLPQNAMAYAVAFSNGTLLVFDKEGRGFRSTRSGHFEALKLPVKTRYWSASFDGDVGFVVGEDAVLIGTRDGGRTWTSYASPDGAPQGVLVHPRGLFVSGAKGVWRSTDGGLSFVNVLTLPGERSDCVRMSANETMIAVACTPLGHTLFRSADGEAFEEIAAPQAANMLGVAISQRGELVAVGAYELILRTRGRSGTLLYHSAQTRQWAQLLRRLEADKLQKTTRARRQERKPLARRVRGVLQTVEGQGVGGVSVKLASGASTMTEPDGRFEVGPSPEFNDQLAVDVSGFAPIRRSVQIDAYDVTDVRLVLHQAVSIRGTLVAASPAPIFAELRLFNAPPADEERARYAERAWAIAVTQSLSDGSFVFQGLEPDEYLLQVRADGFQPFTTLVSAPSSALRVKVFTGAQVTGRFLDAAGQPLAGSPVVLKRAGLETSTQVNAQGAFSIAGLQPGEYMLEATAVQQRVCLSRPVTLATEQGADVVLQLGRGPNITGRVLDDRGSPVPAAMVMGTTSSDPLCGARIAETDLGGEFVLEDVADGVYAVSAVVVGGTMKSGRTFAEKQAKPGDRVEVRLTR